MTHLTNLDELKRHISVLASVEATDAPFVSAYFNLEERLAGWRETLDERAYVLRRVLKGDTRADFEDALSKIENWLTTELHPDATGRLSSCAAPSAAASCCRCSSPPRCPTG